MYEVFLDNPVYYALTSGDKHLAFGNEKVKFFDEKVSPFAGFREKYDFGFDELYELLPPDRTILYATTHNIAQPERWKQLHKIKGIQMMFNKIIDVKHDFSNLIALKEQNIEEMMQLASLTRPGPFGARTIDFGQYFGIFDKGKLIAMAGQRFHVQNYTEISAVCTHPDYLGKGYATALVLHQVQLILERNKIPFLHVREDNTRAIEVYKRIGFEIRGPMNFYVLKKLQEKILDS